tara:strand:+ start:128 stop:247 length:120 start_codon:yes stop_codon:yes gene_type:complete
MNAILFCTLKVKGINALRAAGGNDEQELDTPKGTKDMVV